MNNLIKIQVNGKEYKVQPHQTIFDACKSIGIYIPTLCYHHDVPAFGLCGLCIVEVDGSGIVHSCVHRVSPNMSISTNSRQIQKQALTQFNRFMDMSIYPQSRDIEDLFNYFEPRDIIANRKNDKTYSITFNSKKCIGCDRCVRMCADVQGIGALVNENPRISDNECIHCGQCITICPTDALTYTKSGHLFLKAIGSKKICILQIAPAVRVSIGELFGEETGTICTGKIIHAAKLMGFKYVFDTCFGADMTVVEEGDEFLERIKKRGPFPMFTSCCPSWISFVEKSHIELISNLSSAKSPHMMLGSAVKNYFAKKIRVNPDNIFLCSLMPCVSKKGEIMRMQMKNEVDCVITTVEFVNLMKQMEIYWHSLKMMDFDSILGNSSGAAQIFGASGGVTEAVARYLHEKVTGSKLRTDEMKYDTFRGFESLKTAEIKIQGIEMPIKIAVCNGINAAKKLINSEKHTDFHFIEVMSCPGGCISGGGQPKLTSRKLSEKRANSLYSIDMNFKKETKTPLDNKDLMTMYDEWINKKPHERHKYLHTHYEKQESVYLFHLRNSRNEITKTIPLGAMFRESLQNLKSLTQTALSNRASRASIKGFSNMSSINSIGSMMSSGSAVRTKKMIEEFSKNFPFSINPESVDEILEKKMAIFVINPGELSEEMDRVYEFLSEICESYDDLSDVKYAVCEFYSKSCSSTVRVGHQLDTVLEHHLAKQLTPFRDIETSSQPDHGASLFERWYMVICFLLGIEPPRMSTSVLFKLTKSKDKSIIEYPLRPSTFQLSTIRKREPMNCAEISNNNVEDPKNKFPCSWMIEIRVPKGTNYKTGDYVEILPKNPPNVVDEIMKILDLQEDEVYKIKSADSSSFIPEIVSVRQILEQYIDLCGKPNREIIKCFAEAAEKEIQEKLHKILDSIDKTKDNDSIDKMSTNNVPETEKDDDEKEEECNFSSIRSIGDFIIEYGNKGVKPDIAKFITNCPKMRSRTFSILYLQEGNLVIIARDYFFHIDNNKENTKSRREGLCSQFLKKASETRQKIAIKVAPGNFIYHERESAPIIIIAYDLGICSSLALIIHRKKNEGKYGDAVLFFECKNKNEFLKIEEQLLKLKNENGALNEYIVAYTDENQSLTENMKNNSKVIWNLWKNHSTAMYISSTSNEKETEINDIMVKLTIKEGGLRDEEAMAYNSRHMVFLEVIKA